MTGAVGGGEGSGGGLARVLRAAVQVHDDEVGALLLACAYFFFLLCGYFILRPIRDEMAVAGGTSQLPFLFLGTLTATLVANPLFSTLVTKFTVKRFIVITYRFFIANLLIFYVLLRVLPADGQVWLGRAFFVWTSVFNLFVVSVFWGFMVDTFRSEQGKRLFGFIGFGGTAGAIVGSAITAGLVERVGTANLLLVSALLLEVATQLAKRFPVSFRRRDTSESPAFSAPASAAPAPPPNDTRRAAHGDAEHEDERPIGGSVWAGLAHISRSPYLLGISLYMLLYTIGSTFLYFQQVDIVGQAFTDRPARTAFLARIDFSVQVLTILLQVFVTGRVIKRLGVAFTLGILPTVSLFGFLSLGLVPTVAVLVAFQVIRRAGEFALSRPAREVLYTVVSREDKYKAKSFIDTFVYRAGDQIGAWTYALMGGVLGMSLAAISFVAVPLSLVWLGVGTWLGRRQSALARSGAEVTTVPPAALRTASP